MSQGPASDVNRLLADQRERWARGERVRVETYLKERPELADQREVLLDLVYHEFLLQRETGEIPTVESYLQRFPDLGDDLKVQIQVHDALDTAWPQQTQTPNWQAAAGAEPSAPAIPDYDILEVLGRGGMGVVYRARQISLDRLVALKMMRAASLAGPEELIRFRMEAEAIARLQHPNIVRIYAIGQHDGRPYLALEHVSGGSLAQYLAAHPTSPAGAARLIECLARAMHFAHLRGIVHRDLKPANVLLETEGNAVTTLQPKITDFGLAKFTEVEADMTETGRLVGTLNYMAPEQAAGKNRVQKVGPATDVYALGVILYQMLTGRVPFQSDSPLVMLDQICHEPPTSPRSLNPIVPRDLENICLKCLQKETHKRYRDAEQLADDLHCFLDGKPVLARPIGVGERLWKWARRRPGQAAAIVAGLCLIVGAAAAIRSEWLRRGEAERRTEGVLKQLSTHQGAADAFLAAGKYDDADAAVARALDTVKDEPALGEQHAQLEARQARVRRLAEFYRLANLGWARAGEENYPAARETCEAALRAVGVLDHPTQWWDHLPSDDIQSYPRELERLEMETYRQLLLLSAIRTFAGLEAQLKLRPSAVQEAGFKGALEALDWAKALECARQNRVSRVVQILERVNQKGLKRPDASGDGQAEPTAAMDYFFLGLIHYFLGKVKPHEAMALGRYFKEFRDLDQKTPMETARRLLERAVRIDSRDFWPWWVLGRTLQAQEQYDAALLAFNACVQIKPDYARGYEQRALTLALFARVTPDPGKKAEVEAEALAESNHALRMAERDGDPAAWWMRAETLAVLDRRAEAIEAYGKAIEAEPDILAKLGRAGALDKAKSYAESVAAAAESDPAQHCLAADANALIALVHLARDNKPAAGESARRALSFNPANARAKDCLAKAE